VSLPLSVYRRMPKRLPLSLGFSRYSLSFNGVDNYVKVPTSPSLQNFTAKTVLIWVYVPPADGLFRYIFDNGFGTPPYGDMFFRHATNDVIRVYLKNTAGKIASIPVGVTPNSWVLVGYSWDGETVTYIKNGASVGTSSLTGTLGCSGQDLFIGSSQGTGGWFNSLIASVLIYNRDLSLREIRYNMINYHSPVRDGLVLWLHDRIVGNTWYDESGYGNNGIIYGAVKKNLSMWELRSGVGL